MPDFPVAHDADAAYHLGILTQHFYSSNIAVNLPWQTSAPFKRHWNA